MKVNSIRNNTLLQKETYISFKQKTNYDNDIKDALINDKVLLSKPRKSKKNKIFPIILFVSALIAIFAGFAIKFKKNAAINAQKLLPGTNKQTPIKLNPKPSDVKDNPPLPEGKLESQITAAEGSKLTNDKDDISKIKDEIFPPEDTTKILPASNDISPEPVKKVLSGDVDVRIREFEENKIQMFRFSKHKVNALKKIDPEVISLIDDKDLSCMMWSMDDDRYSAKKIRRLQKEFTLNELKNIFKSEYSTSDLIKWIQFDRRQKQNEKDILAGLHEFAKNR